MKAANVYVNCLLLAAFFVVGCQEKSLKEVLAESQGDPALSGVSRAERRPNGTVFLTFKGMIGSESYSIYEEKKETPKGLKAQLLSLFNLNDDSAKKGLRLISSIQHVQGKLVYDVESSHIPFGGTFCYSINATTKKSETLRLGQSSCLLNDQNWAWSGLKDISVDGSGRAMVNWNRLPVAGSSYEVEVKAGEGAIEFKKLDNVFDVSSLEDPIQNDIFPRCYRVRVRHPLLSETDNNVVEKCLTFEAWKSEREKSNDVSPPKFLGLKSIEVTRNSSLVGKATQILGIGTSVTVVLGWDEGSDDSDPARRLKYSVFRSETPFGFDFSKPLGTTAAGQLNYVDESIVKGSTYYYLVRALDTRGNLDQNLNQKVLPLDLKAPVFAGLVSYKVRRLGTGVKVELGWNAAEDEGTPAQGITYEIYRSQSSGTFPAAPLGRVLGTTSYEDATAERSQVYYYKALAADKEGNKDSNSAVLIVNTGETPPTFKGVESVTLGQGKARIKWDPAEDDETPTSSIYYRVYRRSDGADYNFKSPLIQTQGGQLQSEDMSVNPNLSYYYVVRAVDQQGFEDTNTKEVQMVANTPPVMNTAPSVQWGKTEKCMKINWTAATDDSTSVANLQYKIFRSNSPDIGSFNFIVPLDTRTNGVRTYLDCQTDGSRGYSYIIRAVDLEESESANSPVGSISPNQPPVVGTVTEKTIVNSTQVRIRWNTATDDRTANAEIKYNLYRFVKSAPTRAYTSGQRLATLDPNVREYLDTTGVSPTTEYSWLIRAVDEYGLESINTTDEVSLDSNLPPNFTGLTAAVLQSQRNINLTWTLASDDRTAVSLLSYKVYVLEVPQGTPTGVDPNFPIPATVVDALFQDANIKQTIQGAVTTVNQSIPDSNKTYVFGIRAMDAQGAFDSNRSVRGVPGNNPPTFGGATEALVLGDGTVRLSWIAGVDDKDNTSEIVYRIYRYTSSNPTEPATIVGATANLYRTSEAGRTTYVDESPLPGANNHYLVRALDKDQAEDTNAAVKVVLRDEVKPAFLGIKTTSMDGARITLVWDPANDNRTSAQKIRYKIYESLSNSLNDLLATTPIDTVTNGTVSYSRTPATGAKYYYLVRAFDEADNADINESIKFTVDEIPPTFSGLNAAFAITGTTAQVFWTSVPNGDIDEVAIYRTGSYTTPISTVKVRDAQAAWVNSFVITGLDLATSYSFVARAKDLYGNEEKNTNSKDVTTLASYPPVFAGLQNAQPAQGIPGLSTIELSWSPAFEVTHYRIFRVQGTSERGEEFDFDFETCQAKWPSVTLPGCTEIPADSSPGYAVTGLAKSTTYSFVVRAIRKDGSLTLAEERNRVMKTASTVNELAPTFSGANNAKPAPGSAGLNTVSVTWDDPSRSGVYDGFFVLGKQLSGNAASFNIPLDFATDASLIVQTISDPAVREAFVGNLNYNTRYCFTVVTRYIPLATLRSVPANSGFKCTTPVPQAPEFAGIKSTVIPGAGGLAFTQLEVQWDAAIGSFTQYEISYSNTDDFVSDANPGSFFGGGNTQVVNTRFTTKATFSGLIGNKTYYFRARARFILNSPAITLSSGAQAVAQGTTSPLTPAGDGILTLTQLADDQVKITWAPPNNNGLFDRYYVIRSEGASAESDIISKISPNLSNSPPYSFAPFAEITSAAGDNFSKTFFVDTGVQADVKYCYLVRAAYSSVQGFVGSSNSVQKCIDVQIKPPQFAGIAQLKTPVSVQGFTSLVASWTPATGNFTKYQYAIGPTPEEATDWVDIAGSAATSSFAINKLNASNTSVLSANTNYFVKVRAIYLAGGNTYPAGQTALQNATTTPKAPQHPGLNPIAFLQNPGEVRLTWSAPDADPEVGGLYNRYLIWKWVNGTGTDIITETNDLMTDGSTAGYISLAEIDNTAYHVDSIASNVTTLDLLGSAKLPENIQTCFLIRAAFLSTNLFVMSPNQTIRCVTPSATAPQFSGIANLSNIPLSIDGFSRLKATWAAASGNFTRYEIALSTLSNATSWSPTAFSSSNVNTVDGAMSFADQDQQNDTTKLISHQRYYARVRAIYVGTGNVIYSAGESSEMSAIVSPDRPDNDGIRSVNADKVPGELPLAKIISKGNASGFWDRIAIFRTVNTDESAARAEIITKSAAKADMSGFVGAPLGYAPRPSSTSTSDIEYQDKTLELGKWNCYITRSSYVQAQTEPYRFLTSSTPQQPVCVQPLYNPVSFPGVAANGSEVCQVQNPGNPEPCDPATRWGGTGNSRVRLKLGGVPQGDFDFFDIYMGTSPYADELLQDPSGAPRTPFQTILRADPIADVDPNDVFLDVGGLANQHILGGSQYFLVRARCLGCPFVDANKNVSNRVVTLKPWLVTSFDFNPDVPGNLFSSDRVGSGRFEDSQGGNAFESQSLGELNLEGADDYVRTTEPAKFAPRPGSTFAIKFNLIPTSDRQNQEGSALFAADSSTREPYWDDSPTSTFREGSLFGLAGAVSVFDQRSGQCLWLGGYAGSARDFGDWPNRDWTSNWWANRRANALRLQSFDGYNFGEMYPRGATPLPRSQPVVAFDPARQTVLLYGGLDQGSPQKIASDTWEYNGKTWERIAEGSVVDQTLDSELGRYGGNVMAQDPFSLDMVMVGGRYSHPGASSPDNPSQARVTMMTGGVADETTRVNKVRNRFMTKFEYDAVAKKRVWKNTLALPGSFPVGYPAALVAIPTGPQIGLYYFSSRSQGGDSFVNNNVWRYDGETWTEMAGTTMPDNNAFSSLYAFHDSSSGRIFVTMGRGNQSDKKRVWEFDPAGVGQAAWTKRYNSDAPPTFGGMPCYDPVRRQLVEYGGDQIDTWVNNLPSVTQVRTPQDIFLFSVNDRSWKRAPVAMDHPNFSATFAAYPKFASIVAHGGAGLSALHRAWGETRNQYTTWEFISGFWRRMWNQDSTKKWSTGGNLWAGKDQTFRYGTLNGTNDTVIEIEQSNENDTNTINGRGKPQTLRVYDGTGWVSRSIDSQDLLPPDDRCPNRALYQAPYNQASLDDETRFAYRAWWSQSFATIMTPWGAFSKGPPMLANIPWTPPTGSNPNPPAANCTSTVSWKQADSPYFFLQPNGANFVAKALKSNDVASNADRFKFCSSVGQSANQPNLLPEYRQWSTHMVWDETDRQIVIFGHNDGDWTRLNKNVQALRMKNEGLTNQCMEVVNLTSPFPNATWNTLIAHMWRFASPSYDPVRRKVIVFSWEHITNPAGGSASNNVDGFIWELDIANKVWTPRLLPQEFTRWTAMAGNAAQVAPIPGKPGEFLMSIRKEIHHHWRMISDNYIVKVTDSAITLRPALPRFGVTLGADKRSAYLSVPGDPGEADGTLNGVALTTGRRKISDDLTGEHTLFVRFNAGNTYSVFLDGGTAPLPNLSNISWAGDNTGLYLSEFVLGARTGSFARFASVSMRQFVGVGNVKARIKWLKMFEKPLTATEMDYWAGVFND